ncbi:hypothetical protein BDV12DRAFT_202734 [Aspergillus spectabilis]
MTEVFKLYKRYLPPAEGKPLIKPCTGALERAVGLPCIHKILTRLDTGLLPQDFHLQWSLLKSHEPLAVSSELMIMNPLRIRARNHQDHQELNICTREPSLHEIVEANVRATSHWETVAQDQVTVALVAAANSFTAAANTFMGTPVPPHGPAAPAPLEASVNSFNIEQQGGRRGKRKRS